MKYNQLWMPLLIPLSLKSLILLGWLLREWKMGRKWCLWLFYWEGKWERKYKSPPKYNNAKIFGRNCPSFLALTCCFFFFQGWLLGFYYYYYYYLLLTRHEGRDASGAKRKNDKWYLLRFFFFFFGLSRLDLARNEAIFVFRLFVFYFFIYYNWAWLIFFYWFFAYFFWLIVHIFFNKRIWVNLK